MRCRVSDVPTAEVVCVARQTDVMIRAAAKDLRGLTVTRVTTGAVGKGTGTWICTSSRSTSQRTSI
jgi:hypothetical protein